MKTKYRIKPYDIVNDIWIIQKRVFLFFWIGMGAGPNAKLEKQCAELNRAIGVEVLPNTVVSSAAASPSKPPPTGSRFESEKGAA